MTRPRRQFARAESWLARNEKFIRWWPGLLALAVYTVTLARVVTGEDSGELIAAAYFFGVPHPPGYPLWTIACGVFTHIFPFGSIAWKANFFSALCSAGAVQFMYFALCRMGFRAIFSGAAAVAGGFATAVWSQSVICEVYTLNLLMTAILIWLTVRWHNDGNEKWLVLGALAFGLGMSNHHTIGFAAFGIFCWAIILRPRLLTNWQLALKCAGVFLLGLVPYAYLIWAAGRDVPVKWGETTTLAAVWEHASRGQYKTDSPVEAQIPLTTGVVAGWFYYGLRWEVKQLTPYLVPVVIAGFVWMWRRRTRRVWLLWTVLLGGCSGLMYLYVDGVRLDRQDQFVHKVFLTPLAMMTAVPLAAGLHWMFAALRKGLSGRTHPRILRVSVGSVAVLIPLCIHWSENNMRNYYYAVDHAENMLACMLPNAILFPSGDHNTFPLIYLVHVEGRRPDITIADKYGYIDMELYRNMPNNPGKPKSREQRKQIEEWLIRTSRKPAYFTVKSAPEIENTRMVSVGILWHLLPDGKEIDTKSAWDKIRYRNVEGPAAPIDYAATNILADYYYALGVRAFEDNEPNTARRHFARAADCAWGIPELFNNIASALAESGYQDEAISYYEDAAKLNWRYVPARWNLARIFRETGKPVWAAKVFEDITRAAPNDFRSYGELGFLYANDLGDMHQARRAWYESLRLNPRQSQIIRALADADHPPQQTPSSQPVDERPGLVLSTHEVNFGELVVGDRPSETLELKNTSEKTIEDLKLKVSCGCVIASLEKSTLEPGEKLSVPVELDTKGKKDAVSELLVILHGERESRVELRATIRPELSASPAELSWTPMPGQDSESKLVRVKNHRERAFRILDISAIDGITAGWDPGAEAVTHEVQLALTGQFGRSVEGTLQVRTSLADLPKLEIPYKIDVEVPAKASPSLIYFGLVNRDQKVSRLVQVKPTHDDLTITPSLDTTALAPGITGILQPTNTERSEWGLEVELDGSKAQPGRLSHRLKIRIRGYDTPIEVQIHGHVAE